MVITSQISSRIEDIELDVSPAGLTRKIIRAEVVENKKNTQNSVKIAIVHQRRSRTDSLWEDLGGRQLSELRAGDAAKMKLDTNQTQLLLTHLLNLYDIGKEGVRTGATVLEITDEDLVIKADISRARVIRKLLAENYSKEFWNALSEEHPTLATKMALARICEEIKQVVEEFKSKINEELGEEFWRKFLSKNRWIFGSNYIGMVRERRINISSTLDHPLITEDGHLEIVEIKSPEYPFWRLKKDGTYFRYREKYLVPNPELSCAIVQGINYVLEAESEMKNKSWADSHDGIYPIKPKCLVVHGRSLKWGEEETVAFRLFNDSLHGVNVITYDHLLSRANQILNLFTQIAR